MQDTSAPLPRRSATGWAGRFPIAIDVGLSLLAAAVFLPAAIPLIRSTDLSLGWIVVLSTAIALLHVTIVVRRRSPVLAYASAGLGMLLLAIAPMLRDGAQQVPAVFLPSAALFFVALYWVAEASDDALALAALLIAAVGGAAVIIRLAVSPGWASQVAPGTSPWLIIGGLTVGGIVAAWSLGRLRRTRLAYLAELQERARRTEADRQAEIAAAAADERARIAREIHDVVSHSLAVVATQAEGGRMATPDETARTVLSTISGTARTALADMRTMLGVLRSDAGREPAPGLDGLPDLLRRCREAGQRIDYSTDGAPTKLTAAQSLAAYRIVQESLTNALKHAPGEPVRLRLTWAPGELTIDVTNPVPPGSRPRPGGRGLVGIRERAETLGGMAQHGVVDGTWQVRATIPIGGKR